MPNPPPVIQVAVPTPLYTTFDYLPPAGCAINQISPGMRLGIPFGRTKKIGIVIETGTPSRITKHRLKPALALLDTEPVIPADIFSLMVWASAYYHHPLGEVMFSAIPTLLRQGQAPKNQGIKRWRLSPTGKAIDISTVKRAPRQAELLKLLSEHPLGLIADQLAAQIDNWQTTMRALLKKEWVISDEVQKEPETLNTKPSKPFELNTEQRQAVTAVTASLTKFQAFLLDGITGSGKTEVYFHIIQEVIAAGRQALVLVPEIGLTPQLVLRFQRRFHVNLAILHSGLSDRERLQAWLKAKEGSAAIVIGTRSAVFTPLQNPGIIIIDEEHDLSFKQQEGFRYHARDIAIVRARNAGIPIVLGSATPSLETLHNAKQERFQTLTLSQRIGKSLRPTIKLLDVCRQKLDNGLSELLKQAITKHLAQNNQVLIFLNRRGYAPTLLCHDCGWVATCQRCDAHMISHRSHGQLRCHHCDAQRRIDEHCPECHSQELRPLGHGTERVEEALQAHFPNTEIIRIDRDSTRRKGSMQALLEKVRKGHNQILLGTQMLAKGHHLPNVTLVGILDADQGLFGVDFRASERMGQLIIQVAGRAGRAEKKGEVLIQTHHPDHPLLHQLLEHNYQEYAQTIFEERHIAHMPPYSSLALLRAEAVDANRPKAFLSEAYRLANSLMSGEVTLLGPVTAPMERRAGRYRAQLLLQSKHRRQLQKLLKQWVPKLDTLPSAKKIRWSLDIDPMEIL